MKRIIIICSVILSYTFCCAQNTETLTRESDTTRVHVIEVGGVSFKMIRVQGGTFAMGATSQQDSYAENDESPVHSVTLDDYYIAETEVTQEL